MANQPVNDDGRDGPTSHDSDAQVVSRHSPRPLEKSKTNAANQAPRKPEKDLWSGRPRWPHFLTATPLVIVVILLVAAAFVDGWYWFVLAAAGVTCAWAVRIAIRIWALGYRLTTERMFTERGIISRTIDQIELIRVDDIRVRQTLIDRVFGLGSVDVLSTDFTDRAIIIEGIRDAHQVAEMIRSHMRSARQHSLFIESL